MRVAVIDPTNGKIVARGESDGKRYDGMYLRVYRDGETDKSAAATLTYAASVFPEGRAEAISAELQRLRTIWKAAEDAYYKELYESANKYKAFTGTETSHA